MSLIEFGILQNSKTQNPLNLDLGFEKLAFPSLVDFVDGDRQAANVSHQSCQEVRYLLRTERYHPEVSNLFVSVTKRQKQVSLSTISFWIRSVLSHACGYVADKDYG